MARFLWVGLVLPLFACEKVDDLKRSIDYRSFEYLGGTFFTQPGQVTTKELHFDTGRLLGREVVLEGDVVSYGRYDTHLVLGDESGRMLVVLTDVGNVDEILPGRDHKGDNPTNARLRVLGSVVRGKKGLPYLLARSVLVLDGSGSVQ